MSVVRPHPILPRVLRCFCAEVPLAYGGEQEDGTGELLCPTMHERVSMPGGRATDDHRGRREPIGLPFAQHPEARQLTGAAPGLQAEDQIVVEPLSKKGSWHKAVGRSAPRRVDKPGAICGEFAAMPANEPQVFTVVCERCGSDQLIPLNYERPPGLEPARVRFDSTADARPRFKCVACGQRSRWPRGGQNSLPGE